MNERGSWRAPKKPSLRLIEVIHRTTDDPDSGVTFAVKPTEFAGVPTHFTPICTIPRAELREWFPEMVEQLEHDSYFSINSFFIPRDKRTGQPTRRAIHPDLDHLPYPAQRAELTQYLNACYTDIDLYKVEGLDFGTAVGKVLSMADSGKIPQPSLYLNSGRGLWVLWLLRDNRDGSKAPPAFSSLKRLYGKTQNAINARFRMQGADIQALDVSRFIRVPGSINSKANKKVAYLLPADSDGKPFSYTLEELADFFAVPRAATPSATRDLADSDTETRRKKMRGALGRWTKELQRFEQLREMRAGSPPAFAKGQRSRALRFYAGVLVAVRKMARRFRAREEAIDPAQEKVAAMEDRDIRAAVRDLLQECEYVTGDNVTGSDADAATREALRRGGLGGACSVSAQTIAEWLGVTLEESDALRGKWPPASKYGPPRPPSLEPLGREAEAADRREFIARFVRVNGGKPPTLRELQAKLAAVGDHASTRTIMKDLKAIGIGNPRSREAKRAAKAASEAPLFHAAAGTEPGPALGAEPSGQVEQGNSRTDRRQVEGGGGFGA